MEIQQDFRDLLALFNEKEVDYLVVEAYALAFHGAPRYTGDLDIYVKPDRENARRIMAALREFGFGKVGLSEGDFEEPDQVVQLGVAPVRVDLVTSITGVTWKEAFCGRAESSYGDQRVYFLGREQLIQNKRALGRKKDLADLEAIGEE